MKINILTIFPEIYENFFNTGIISHSLNKLYEVNIIDIRNYSTNKHHKVDDYVYGDKQGMLLTCQPIFSAIEENNLENTHTIFTSPKGQVLNQRKLYQLSQFEEITILTARYEGVDQRVIDEFVDEEISIGDYIITGGEIASQVIIDGILRLLPGVINNSESHFDESFAQGLLEQPQYTRPQVFRDLSVPEVLVNGNHQKIKEWITYKQIEETYNKRPDLLPKVTLTQEQKKIYEKLKGKNEQKK